MQYFVHHKWILHNEWGKKHFMPEIFWVILHITDFFLRKKDKLALQMKEFCYLKLWLFYLGAWIN